MAREAPRLAALRLQAQETRLDAAPASPFPEAGTTSGKVQDGSRSRMSGIVRSVVAGECAGSAVGRPLTWSRPFGKGVCVAEESSGSPAGAVPPGVDPSVPNPARVWNYWLGGKDNYQVDREVGDETLRALPVVGVLARADRAFLGRAVRYLAGEARVRQFLDIGTGIPTANNTHEVAQAVAPEARIVYTDNDPVVLAHARALLTSTAPGKTDYIDADLREPGKIMAAAAQTLDLGQPIAVLLLAILGFISDSEDPHAIVAQLMDPLPAGSYLVISHPAEGISDEMAEAARIWNERSPYQIKLRSPADIARFFDGLELLEPGVVQLPEWRPDTAAPRIGSPGGTVVPHYCGVGRKI